MIILYIFGIILALFLVAFFAGSETAFTSVRFMKLVHLIENKNKPAVLVHNILKRPDIFLATTLVGTNIFVVAASAFATDLFFKFNNQNASLIASIIMIPIILIFSEIVPKVVSQNKANEICLKTAPFIILSQRILFPVVLIVNTITSFLLNLIGPKEIKKNPFLTRDEIKLIIRDIEKEGIIEDYEREVIDRIFDFTLTKAADIMVPLKNVVYIDYVQLKDELIEKSKKFGFTRIPVFEDKKIIGIVNIFDIFYNDKDRDWHEFIRPLKVVSFDDRLDAVFSVMQPNKETMAAVLKDDSPIGILTMEDLIEEIVSRAKPLMKE